MLGAIAGDIIGSLYENLRTKRKDFRLFTPLSFFTDDTVLTVADILNGISKRLNRGFKQTIADFCRRFGTQRMIEQSAALVRSARGGPNAGEP